MTDIEKVEAFIEKLKAEQLAIFSKGEDEEGCGDALTYIGAYNQLLSFIYSLKAEPIPQDLEEAAEKLAHECGFRPESNILKKIFKAGVQWQINKTIKWMQNYFLHEGFAYDYKKAMEGKL